MPAHKVGGRRLHGAQIQRPVHVQGVKPVQRVAHRRVVDAIDIGLCPGALPGVKTRWDLLRRKGGDVVGQEPVQRRDDPVCGYGPVYKKIDDLSARVHTRVGPTGRRHPDFRPGQPRETFLQDALDGRQPARLFLEPAVAGPVVGQDNLYVPLV